MGKPLSEGQRSVALVRARFYVVCALLIEPACYGTPVVGVSILFLPSLKQSPPLMVTGWDCRSKIRVQLLLWKNLHSGCFLTKREGQDSCSQHPGSL